MSSVSGMRESSSSSTVITHVPSSSGSSAVTLSASRPVISLSSSRARAASAAPEERSRLLRLRFSSAISIPFLWLGYWLRLGALRLLLEDLAPLLCGLLLADLAALALLLKLVDLLHGRGRAELLPLDLLVDLVRHPHREAERRRR